MIPWRVKKKNPIFHRFSSFNRAPIIIETRGKRARNSIEKENKWNRGVPMKGWIIDETTKSSRFSSSDMGQCLQIAISKLRENTNFKDGYIRSIRNWNIRGTYSKIVAMTSINNYNDFERGMEKYDAPCFSRLISPVSMSLTSNQSS